MADVITHNIDQVVNRLTAFQRTVLPRAAKSTVHKLGFELSKRYLPGYMKTVFKNPNNFTLRSVSYKVVSNYEVQLSFRQNVPKGNDPARYLYPVLKEGGGGKSRLTQPNSRGLFTVLELPQKVSTQCRWLRTLQKTPMARFRKASTQRSGPV